MKCVILGASGFIGTALTQRLVQSGDTVAGWDVTPPEHLASCSEFRKVDLLRDEIEFSETPDVVFYLAQSLAYRDLSKAEEVFLVNTAAAIRAYYASVRSGARCFVYASSGNVYAPSFEPLNELAPLHDAFPYALSKRIVERWLAATESSTTAIVGRFFGVFGPNQRAMLPFVLRQRVESGEIITLDRNPHDSADCEGLRVSFCYIDDAVRTLHCLALRALSHQDVPSAINIGGPEPISVRRFADAIGKRLGRQPQFELTDRFRAGDLIADVSRMRSLIDFEPTQFEAAIERTITS